MAEIVNLGSLYLNGQPKDLGVEYDGEVLSFGNTIPGKTIPFVKWGKLLVASQCVCTNISWDELNKAGYIFGCPVKIDGTFYLCRSLKVGEKNGVPNEWDSILDNLGEDDNLWHWRGHFFWGQEVSKYDASTRAVRGCHSARFWNDSNGTSRHVFVGFRPVLEPLAPEPLISGSLIGATLKLYGPNKAFSGRLEEFSDYDLVIEPSAQQLIPADCKWVSKDGGRIIVERSAITWMQEVD